jgi:hypothetical protein
MKYVEPELWCGDGQPWDGDRRLKRTETFLVIDWFIRFVSVILISIFGKVLWICDIWIQFLQQQPINIIFSEKIETTKKLQPVVESPPLRISLLCSVRFGGGTVMEAWRRWNRDGRLKKENDRGREYAFFS